MGLYDGFDVQAMLNFMSEHVTDIDLKMLDQRKWRLYVLSEQHGEFELEGGLFHVVMIAFRPFLADAKDTRAQLRQQVESIINAEL